MLLYSSARMNWLTCALGFIEEQEEQEEERIEEKIINEGATK